jgi:hypothetical protein
MKKDLVVMLKVGELENIINRSIEGAINKVLEKKLQEILTRGKEVAQFFSVSLEQPSTYIKKDYGEYLDETTRQMVEDRFNI